MNKLNKHNPIATAVRTALLTGFAVAVAMPSIVRAEDAATSDEDDDKRITITGSRIKRMDVETASPITTISHDDLEVTGLTDVGDMIQSVPSMSGSPIGTTTNNGGNGDVRIDLRGMGSARTLTLINGHRIVDGGDFQAIPSTMIKEIQILKDGSSAVYGADAVSGVVNIITRRDFSGLEFTAQTVDWNNTKGAGQDSISMISGQTFDRGNFVFGAEFVKQDAAFQRDTPWDFMQNSFYIYPGGCEHQVAAPYDGTPQGGCYPVGSSRIPESRLPFFSQGLFLIGTPATTPNEVGLMVPHDGRTYNYAPVNYLQTPYKRTNIFAEANFEVTDSINFSSEFRGNQRTSAQQLAPLPFTGGDPMFNGFYDDPATGNTVAFTGISQDNYYLRRAVDAYNAANGTSLIYEPVVNPRRRMIETNRRFEQNITQYQWTAGFDGEFGESMSWNVFLNEGHRSIASRDFGQFSGARLFNALGPSADLDGDGNPECYTDITNPGTLIAGCVPLNLFGGGAVDAGGNPTVTTLTQAMLDYVSLDTIDTIVQDQRTAGANLTGDAMDLEGGVLGWSIGWSYWKQKLAVTLDSAKTIGAVTGNVGASTQGSLVNNAVYGEFHAPLLDNLSLSGGLRYDDWDQFKGKATYQAGIEFRPLDSFKLRATYGTVFRAPTITDLFGGLVDSFPTYSDPCVPVGGASLAPGCDRVGVQTDSQVLAKVGGNPELQPETGDTLTAGLVWSPEFGDHSFNFLVDYWKINLNKGISQLGVQFTLDDCYVNLNQSACSLITRNPDYSVKQILDTQLNVSKESAKGIDTEIGWSYPSEFGLLEAKVLWTHLLNRKQQQFAGSSTEDFAGTYSASLGAAFAEDKANISFQWTQDDWSIAYLGEYISGLKSESAITFNPVYYQHVPSKYYSDIVASYTFSTSERSSLRIAAGITNLTNEAPPFIDNGFNGKTDPSTYRMFGQGYYLRLKWTY